MLEYYLASEVTCNQYFLLQTNLPIFKLKESCVRRRYSDFEWLKNELERDSKVRPGSDLPIPASRVHGNSCSDSLELTRRELWWWAATGA